jgi:cytidine deaminase
MPSGIIAGMSVEEKNIQKSRPVDCIDPKSTFSRHDENDIDVILQCESAQQGVSPCDHCSFALGKTILKVNNPSQLPDMYI